MLHFILRQLSGLVLRKADTAHILLYLSYIANNDGVLRHVAHLLLEAGVKISARSTDSFDRFADSIASEYPEYSSYVRGINHGTISSTKFWLPSPEEAQKEKVKTPFLIQRMKELFWTHFHQHEQLADLFSQYSTENLLEAQSVNTALLVPNFVFEFGDRRVSVHDWVLYARWPWFASLVDSGLSEFKSGCSSLPSGTLSESTFIAWVYYLYTNDPRAIGLNECRELVENAEYFRLAELGTFPLKGYDYSLELIDWCQQLISSSLSTHNCIEKLKISLITGPRQLTSKILNFMVTCDDEIEIPDGCLDASIVADFEKMKIDHQCMKEDGYPSNLSDLFVEDPDHGLFDSI